MSRDVSWGFYIANFTYLVGVAAGGVMVVLPYYLHDYKAYGRSPFWASFWPSLPSSCACCSFWSTWGSPCAPSTCCFTRRPTPCCSGMIVLNGYLFLKCRGHRLERWKPSATAPTTRNGSNRLSIYPFPGREHPHRDRLPVLRPARASLLAHGHSGAALSGIGLCRRTGPADPAVPLRAPVHQFRSRAGSRSRPWPKPWLTPSASTSFFFLCEVFVAFYSNIPGHMHPSSTSSWACTATAPGTLDVGLHDPDAIGIILTVTPATRKNEMTLAAACASSLSAPGLIRVWE
jgi:hypothetical protein